MKQPTDIRGPLAPETQRVLNEAWAGGVLPPSEPQGGCERSSLATCSLPVSLVEKVIRRLETAAQIAESSGCYVSADDFREASKTIRAEMEAATMRQQAENKQVSNAPQSVPPTL